MILIKKKNITLDKFKCRFKLLFSRFSKLFVIDNEAGILLASVLKYVVCLTIAMIINK